MEQGKFGQWKKSRCKVNECKRNPHVSLHLLPKNDAIRRLWMKNLKLCSIVKNPFHVCSNHFQEDDFCGGIANGKRQRLRYNAVPSKDLPKNKFCSNHELLVKECQSPDNHSNDDLMMVNEADFYLTRDVVSELIKSTTEEDNSNNDLIMQMLDSSYDMDLSLEDEMLVETLESTHDEMPWNSNCESFSANENSAAQVSHKANIKPHVTFEDKCIQVNLAYDEALKPVTLNEMLKNDSDLQSWTGISTFVLLTSIVNCVKNLSAAKDQLKKFKVSPEVLTVIVMTKMKTNLTFKQLSCVFGTTPSTLATYFDEFIPILRAVLTPAIFWPNKNQISKNLPKSFKPDFSNCRGIMDCTEMPIVRLKWLESKIKTLSHYKGCHTAKLNVTSAPSGLVIDVSSVWGGKASDKHIVVEEKILEKFCSDDAVMVDKGYHILKEAEAKGIQVYRPPIPDKPQLTTDESIYNTNVARSRIHVERVIQRIKIFDIFKSKINTSMLKHIDDITFIACAIMNLSPPVLADDKF